MLSYANHELLVNQLTQVSETLDDIRFNLTADKAHIIIPDLYDPMGRLVAITRAIRGVLDTLPVLSEFDPSEYYHSEGQNPGEFMRRAELALTAAIKDLSQLDTHLNEAWSSISPIGLKGNS